MTGREILHKMKVKAGFGSSTSNTGKGKTKMYGKRISHGYHLVKGQTFHAMEDYVVAQFKHARDSELGLFAIFDGHLGHDVPDYLQSHLFDTILKQQPNFLTDTDGAIRKAYEITDSMILNKANKLGKGGSTAVTAILIDGLKLVVANVGDSRAVLCKDGLAKQLSVDHEPNKERKCIEMKGGFVSNLPGDVPRVDGQLAVARAFGDRSLKVHLSSVPDVKDVIIDDKTEFLVLASDGLWKVMSNQEVVDAIRDIEEPQVAAKHLTEEALKRKSKDDISCIVVKFQ
ncbi:probable protein phosphatase 2C 62 isoform X1 [Dendrobium catenatum]|uniref:probable protein phosphatase 2C 62 isoform X1 n=1 Tax=Dendrobium catenatum TaxID=906689 RepID=UPI0009F41FB3|nr:probable protein phosphatase 2C 62 isoform X1 [Dendrobium catenatum]